ncbi:MAG: ParB N-terminal domain-containing protein [Spirochaetaceae bacterium]|nr:ParB N-terminal domain-containing protein [Spirochaetaceae bacterium]MBQ8562061.1 ParB N-terminal domain-containing protein [Spirochaetaceae bacterium]
MLVDINQIQVSKRVRKDLGDLTPLMDSLKRYGLLNPITITKDYKLIAGQRRLESARQLGWTTIDAVVVDIKDPVARLEIELEENTQRSNFTELELLEGYKQLEKLRNPGFFRRIWNAIKSFFKKLFKKN